jgi:hypothetical protein
MRAKIAADTLKADVGQKKHDFDVKRADNYADRLELVAGFAIDYAIAAVEQAEWAVLDAVVSRAEPEQARAS